MTENIEDKKDITIESKEEKVSKKIIKTETKQLIWFFIIVFICFLAFLIPYFYNQSQKVFEYAGVTWQVEEDGKGDQKITWYHTVIPKIDNLNTNYGNHHFFFRNDPRLKNIDIDIGTVQMAQKWQITFQPEILQCEKNPLSLALLQQLSIAFPYVKDIDVGVTNQTIAQEQNITYHTCEKGKQLTTTLQIEFGDENKITQHINNMKNCYMVEIKNCDDVLNAVEKLFVEFIKQSNFQEKEK